MYPAPTTTDLATYSGRPETTYTTYASQALLQATIRFTFLTEVWSLDELPTPGGMSLADAQQLATTGICALADDLYLKQPYQATMANPLQTETIGSYSYSKAMANGGMGGSMSRMAPGAMELNMENTGIPLFDLATQLFAKRTLAGGVVSGSVTVFEEGGKADGAQLYIEDSTGRQWVLGPMDKDQLDIPYDINGEAFPSDPGLG